MQQQAAAYLDTCHWLSNITTEALTQTCFINITTNLSASSISIEQPHRSVCTVRL
jgi:hypothetical protein